MKKTVSAVDTTNATADEKAKLKAILETCDALLAKINAPDTSTPDISDDSQPIIPIILMAASILGLSISFRKRRKGSMQ